MHEILKKAREQKGLTTREISKLLFIDQALISKFENGQRLPTRNQIIQIAELLEIDLDLILKAWLITKIRLLIAGESMGLSAIQEIEQELNPGEKNKQVVEQLFEEMEALRIKMDALRNSPNS